MVSVYHVPKVRIQFMHSVCWKLQKRLPKNSGAEIRVLTPVRCEGAISSTYERLAAFSAKGFAGASVSQAAALTEWLRQQTGSYCLPGLEAQNQVSQGRALSEGSGEGSLLASSGLWRCRSPWWSWTGSHIPPICPHVAASALCLCSVSESLSTLS